MKLLKIAGVFMTVGCSFICNAQVTKTTSIKASEKAPFDYVAEQFADIKVLRYQISGWEKLRLT